MPYTLPWTDKEACKPVYVVMHYCESSSTAPPMAEEGCNVGRSVSVAQSGETARNSAQRFIKHRASHLGSAESDITFEKRRQDCEGGLIGDDWMLTLREKDSTGSGNEESKVVGRELVWVERQWMELDLSMPHTLPWIDAENAKVVYVVMYYREAFATPPPMAAQVIVASTYDRALQAAEMFVDHQKSTMNIDEQDVSFAGNLEDCERYAIGDGWRLTVRGVKRETSGDVKAEEPELDGEVVGRELVWVETQFMLEGP